MGIKRALDAEEFLESSFSLPEPLDHNEKLNLNIDESHISSPKADFPGAAKNISCELDYDEPLEYNDPIGTYATDKELELSAPISLVTSNGSEEEVSREGPTSFCPNFLSLPRKEVPIGPDYQADIPRWDPTTSRKYHPALDDEPEQELMSTFDGLKVGLGRAECTCLDMGSVRCVQQHVKEAREKLLESLGLESFVKLGFCEMGEEVALGWTEGEERAFHEIVQSNRSGIWEHLRAKFPSRRMKEIVSYYFNVFMLQRRAVQNRSFMLEIDSDGDKRREDPGSVYPDNSYEAQGQNGDDDWSTVNCIVDEDLDVGAEPEKVNGDNEVSKEENGAAYENVEKKEGGDNEVAGQDTAKVRDSTNF